MIDYLFIIGIIAVTLLLVVHYRKRFKYKGPNCPNCGSDDTDILYTGTLHTNWHCRSCFFSWVEKTPEPEEEDEEDE